MMHPMVDYPGQLSQVWDELARPRLSQLLRDPHASPDPRTEASLAHGYRLLTGDFKDAPQLPTLQDDFTGFMMQAMGVQAAEDGYAIRLVKGQVTDAPQHAVEAHQIDITARECTITAPQWEGIRRAVYRLEDDMQISRFPALPLGTVKRWSNYRSRIIRNPLAPYRWLSGWELEDDRDFYPEAYLQKLSHAGINGLWVPGLLRNLVPSRVIPELGPDQPRLGKLNELIERAGRYGIGIHLFCIEPRALSPEHPLRFLRPELCGHDGALCPSQPVVLEYVHEVMQRLFTEAPGLAGVINIPCGERSSSCVSSESHAQLCPRCREHARPKLLGKLLSTMAAGIHSVKPQGQFVAWTYLMDKNRETAPITPMLDVMKETSPGVIWMGNFEHGSKKEVFGKKITLHEYSLSCVGPSDYFRQMVKAARDHGLTMHAKMQIGTSYELSSVPYVPVPGIVYDKLQAGDEDGVRGAMLGWIPGGFPGPLLHIVGEAAFEPRREKRETLWRLAALDWGRQKADTVVKAWEIFAEAWQNYPFGIGVLYWGPITRAAAYQLHLEREERLAKPYNWGTNRTRERQPFEDRIERWLEKHYTWQEVASAYRHIAKRWQEGLDLLASQLDQARKDTEEARQFAIAKAVQLQCLAAANVYEFYGLRNTLLSLDDAAQKSTALRMHQVVLDDREVSRQMLQCMATSPIIGFQSEIFDYSFNVPLVQEKVIQLTDLLPTLARWSKHGIEPVLLQRTIEEAQWIRPDTIPERWGD